MSGETLDFNIENIFDLGDKERIKEHYGEAFLRKVLKDVETYAKKWELYHLHFVSYFSINCIFTGYSRLYGNIVLKIGKPSKETFTEYQTLIDYKGHCFCEVYNAEIENGVLLLENIKPGTQLREEKSLENRLDVFCNIYINLHRDAHDITKYPTYLGWVQRITKYMRNRNDCVELFKYMKIAEEICIELSRIYTKSKLLHGDLHHDNILLGNDGQYRLIDPKGVIGDSIFDIGRFILNESYNETPDPKETVKTIIKRLAEKLNIPEHVIMKGFFIEITMGNCWSVEDGDSVEYSKQLENIGFVKGLLDEYLNL